MIALGGEVRGTGRRHLGPGPRLLPLLCLLSVLKFSCSLLHATFHVKEATLIGILAKINTFLKLWGLGGIELLCMNVGASPLTSLGFVSSCTSEGCGPTGISGLFWPVIFSLGSLALGAPLCPEARLSAQRGFCFLPFTPELKPAAHSAFLSPNLGVI